MFKKDIECTFAFILFEYQNIKCNFVNYKKLDGINMEEY